MKNIIRLRGHASCDLHITPNSHEENERFDIGNERANGFPIDE